MDGSENFIVTKKSYGLRRLKNYELRFCQKKILDFFSRCSHVTSLGGHFFRVRILNSWLYGSCEVLVGVSKSGPSKKKMFPL